jgi:PHD/YefM family antitoxin component YafN of YafNO toxin-antitoxin module
MTADQEPQIADDGVQEVPLTIARPLLTRLIEQVREDGVVSALTVRGRRRAYLVTPDFYDRALAALGERST